MRQYYASDRKKREEAKKQKREAKRLKRLAKNAAKSNQPGSEEAPAGSQIETGEEP